MNRNLGPTVEGRDYSCPLPLRVPAGEEPGCGSISPRVPDGVQR